MAHNGIVYEFGDFCLDPFEQVLLCSDKPVHLTLKAFAVLRILVERSGHVVEKDELMRQCWPDAFVEDANLAQTICMLRKVLGERHHSHEYVETVSRRGYRFVALVNVRHKLIEATRPLAIQEEKSVAYGRRLDTGQVTNMRYAGEDFHEKRRPPAKWDDGRDQVRHLYMRGRFYWHKYTVEGLNTGIDYFRQAIKLDPEYALAHTGLADCYYRLSNIHLAPRRAMPKAKSAVVTALRIDEALAEAHALMALIRVFYDRDWAAAEDEFQRAIELAPASALPYKRYGWALGMLGRFDEAIPQINRALHLGPESPELCVGLGIVLHLARRYDAAIAQAQRALDVEPDFFPAHVLLGIASVQQGRLAEAVAELQEAASLADVPWTLGYLGYAYGVAGKRRQALNVLTDLQQRSKRAYVSPYAMALIHTSLGHRQQALQLVKRTYKERNEMLGFVMSGPELDDLRSDRKFATLLDRNKLIKGERLDRIVKFPTREVVRFSRHSLQEST